MLVQGCGNHPGARASLRPRVRGPLCHPAQPHGSRAARPSAVPSAGAAQGRARARHTSQTRRVCQPCAPPGPVLLKSRGSYEALELLRMVKRRAARSAQVSPKIYYSLLLISYLEVRDRAPSRCARRAPRRRCPCTRAASERAAASPRRSSSGPRASSPSSLPAARTRVTAAAATCSARPCGPGPRVPLARARADQPSPGCR